MPKQSEGTNGGYIFQQDGCPYRYHNGVRGYLNEHLPHRWIGRIGQNDNALMK
ncbi:hypothetical protein C0J52_27955 [Blattella germanica]|nr:hypothetical protein C0J52_27955 [Blattella germanica]